MVRNYNEFIGELLRVGFSQFGGRKDSVVCVIPHAWNDAPPDTAIHWHSGDPDRDPWQWRMRVLARDDIAYARVFFGKNGFITRDWYPYFLAARRGGRDFDEAYADGMVSRAAKRIYEALRENGPLPAHALKSIAGFAGKTETAAFGRAQTELEMGLYVTLCGQAQKVSRAGESYGWHSNMLCTVEEFWPAEVFEQADALEPDEAREAITAQIHSINPNAAQKQIDKFIFGR